MLITYFRIHIILMFFITFSNSQSFDIYDSSIKLTDHNYNLTKDSSLTALYQYPKSVKLENKTNELLDPIIMLNSSESLQLSFDILNNDVRSYAYTFIHCDSNWEYSDMIQTDYLTGFYDNYIEHYEYSFNTLSEYVHYNFEFPNAHVNFKKSGNYVVLVYDSEQNIPIITKRFMIYEDILLVEMNIKKATLAKDQKDKQEINFFIGDYKKLNITNPHTDLKIIIQKNDEWKNIKTNPTPSFINNEKIEYEHQEALLFLGGNEYLDFDIKSLRYYGKNIQSIEKKNIQGSPIYYVLIQEDVEKTSKYYDFKYDLNGKYVLSVAEDREQSTEGEYALVKFVLKSKHIENSNIYIYGELTNWNIIEEAQMNYNQKDQHYYGFLYLKQGYYNYQYIVQDKKHLYVLGGNYQETRNEYSIYIYHTPVWSNYDRLVGIAKSTSNSLN